MNDAVNNPNHYQLFADGTEALDVIKSTLTIEEFIGYCKGNVLKYRLRAGKKDALEQDIAKAETYARMLEVYLGQMSELVYLEQMSESETEVPDHPADLEIMRREPMPKGHTSPRVQASDFPLNTWPYVATD